MLPGLIPGIATLGGAVINGITGASAQDAANEANERMADKQMQFQERMSNSAFQRSRKDLEAAGYNPMLGYMNPASSPGGASSTAAPVNPASGIGPGISNGISTAIDTATALQDLDNKGAAKALTEAQTTTEASKALATANSARESELRGRVLSAELPARAAKAKVDTKQAGWDDSAIAFDNITKRAKQVTDLGSSALDMIPSLKGLMKKLPKLKSNKSDPNYSDSVGEAMDKFLKP